MSKESHWFLRRRKVTSQERRKTPSYPRGPYQRKKYEDEKRLSSKSENRDLTCHISFACSYLFLRYHFFLESLTIAFTMLCVNRNGTRSGQSKVSPCEKGKKRRTTRSVLLPRWTFPIKWSTPKSQRNWISTFFLNIPLFLFESNLQMLWLNFILGSNFISFVFGYCKVW